MERTISGQIVDRPAVSLWRHFPVDDQNPEYLARSILKFQERFDFDFIKVTPASSYCLKDWGVIDEWQGNPEGTRKITRHPVENGNDWGKVKSINPTRGSLADQLTCLNLIRYGITDATPIIQTIFSPLSQAKNLVGKENIIAHIRMYPNELKHALQIITNTTIDFIQECKKLQIDGIFYAIQQAQYSLLTLQEFREFGQYFDLQVLKTLNPLWFNVGHIHGTDIMFDEISQYPVQVLNWHDLETKPNLDQGKQIFKQGAVCGGLRQWDSLAYGTPAQVKEEARVSINATKGARFILGTGCVTPIITADSNIFAAREVVEEFAGALNG
ncbi:MAG: uroporphyrinogen decarboxylase family protein [Anaerolineaceae bacterium]